MGKKLALFAMLIPLVVVVMPIVQGSFAEMDEWFQNTKLSKEKVTKFHFYFHDIVSGKNPTVVRVAQSSITDKSPTLFGMVDMMDDPLTLGPEPDSKLVGRAQGLYGFAGQQDISLIMAFTFSFTHGKYNGSSISILGRNPILQSPREMPVVGGSGVFRLARGMAIAKTYTFNTTSHDAVVEYNVFVIHY